jgi:hypothetical protein
VGGVDLAGKGMTPEDFTRPPGRALEIRAQAGLGYRALGMDMTTNVDSGLDNYLLDADATAVVVDVDVRKRLGGRWIAGADARAIATLSSDIQYPGPHAASGTFGYQTFALDAGARIGVHAHDAIDLAARAGAHYDAFLPESGIGMMPKERLLGVTAGARLDIIPPRSRFSASARFDVLALGSRAQTAGLQDGQTSTAHAVWGGATVRYWTSKRWSPFASYDAGRMTTTWHGASSRAPGVTRAERIDTTQLIQLGIAADL